jgi:formylglycine-generating enzyme required for sulfatase activity
MLSVYPAADYIATVGALQNQTEQRDKTMRKNRILDQRIRITGGLAALLVFAVVGCKPQPVATSTATFIETPAPSFTITPLPQPTNTPVFFTPTALPAETTDAKGVVMRLVPAGPFTMGSSSGMPDEKPIHIVNLPAFYMDKYEVTNALYKVCVDAGACQVPANTSFGIHGGVHGTYGDPQFDNYPVIWVDWNRSKTYCEWRGARLPSEIEWEKAARGTDGRKYPWGDVIDPTFANYGINVPDKYNGIFGKTTAVGSYPKGQSPYGIYDMAGNVWEWVADWYDVYPGGDLSANSAFGQQTYRVLRGGSWNDDPDLLRTTFRGGNTPDTTVNYIGFRCASTP